jgi:hypothetical protein
MLTPEVEARPQSGLCAAVLGGGGPIATIIEEWPYKRFRSLSAESQ